MNEQPVAKANSIRPVRLASLLDSGEARNRGWCVTLDLIGSARGSAAEARRAEEVCESDDGDGQVVGDGMHGRPDT